MRKMTIKKNKKNMENYLNCVKKLEDELNNYKEKYEQNLSHPRTRMHVKKLNRLQTKIASIERQLNYYLAFTEHHDRYVKKFTDIMNYCTYMMNNE